MKKLSLSVFALLAAFVIGQSSPQTPKKQQIAPPGRTLQQIDYGEYTVKPPPGQKWQVTTDPNHTSEALVEFNNPELKAFAFVKDYVTHESGADIHAKLLSLSAAMRKALEGKGKVFRFDSTTQTVRGHECLSMTAIVNPTQAIPGVPPNSNQVLHSWGCFYVGAADHADHLVELNYVYTADGETDPQKQQAEVFFGGLQFKDAPAK